MNLRFDNTYAALPEIFFERCRPMPVAAPKMVVWNQTLGDELGIDTKAVSQDALARIFSGGEILEGSSPIAQAYAGHQFGSFTMLGDGRAHLLGEVVTPSGARFDLALKGSGRTRYSRRGDGRAALGQMLREYIISEAMHTLNIPTTRSLCVVATGEMVMRETPLQGAILTRIASSHIRVGTFEFAAMQNDPALVKILLDYAINRHDPDIKQSDTPALDFLKSVGQRQASLMAKWLGVGFIHGVMNTDNMTISGETIDYGPCAFMDTYDPKTVFSSIDHHGRYAYGNQPKIAQWNLARLAETLLPLIHENQDKATELAEEVVVNFSDMFKQEWLDVFRKKLGLEQADIGDDGLISDFLTALHAAKIDFTNGFRSLDPKTAPVFAKDWHQRWTNRWTREGIDEGTVLNRLKAANPARIPRNHHVEAALSAAEQGDLSVMHDLLAALKNPYDHAPQFHAYTMAPTMGERVFQTFCGT